MKKIIVLLLMICFCLPVLADTTYPSNARYVIVNPNGRLKVSTTFLLDTRTGKTWQLVTEPSGGNCWQQMPYDWYKQDGSFGGMTFKAPAILAP